MDLSKVYSGTLMKAEDLQKPRILVISKVVAREFKDKAGNTTKEMAVVSFRGENKELALNKTNFRTISDMYGSESDDWIGKKVMLFKTKVDFSGKRVDAIRVQEPPDFHSDEPMPEEPLEDSEPPETPF